MSWLPNFLTVTRIFVAFMFPFVSRELWLPIISYALATEYLDGKLARMFRWDSRLGQLLDPIADKLFAFSVGLTMVIAGKVLWFEFLFISVKDVAVTLVFIAVLLFYRSEKNVAKFIPNFPGKMTTAFQYIVFLSAVLFPRPFLWSVYLAGAASVVSASLYVFHFINELREHRRSTKK